ncbi:MAG: AP-3 complex subunit beta [Phylliscum demangeonii]|nr:MAG: AP-3 complex subunit beta [Phylliscum demangeonii]
MESISRISHMLETARDLTLEAAQSASALRSGGNSTTTTTTTTTTSARAPLPTAQLKKLLDSRNERDVLDGMQRVITMMYRGQSCLALFSSVVKNVASRSLAIRKLVYLYVLHHAEADPDLALLSINTIQRALADGNAAVRALALRVMSGMRVPLISPIVGLAIRKARGDMSPVVRRAAAFAVGKCDRLDAGARPQLLESVDVLLRDGQCAVVGAAAIALVELGLEPAECVRVLHRHYRALVAKLLDMDEWGQLATLRLLVVYARRCFPPPPGRSRVGARRAQGGAAQVPPKAFYDDDDDNQDEGKGRGQARHDAEDAMLDPDLELLLTACRPLLHSRNAAVIVAVARCYLYLGRAEHLVAAAGPLVSLLRAPADMQAAALANTVVVCMARPQAFVRYATRFLRRQHDPPAVRRLKLELLTLTFPWAGAALQAVVLHELEHACGHDPDRAVVRDSMRALGRCAAQRTDDDDENGPTTAAAARCLRLLLRQSARHDDPRLVADALTVIRHLMQQQSARPQRAGAHRAIVRHLATRLATATDAHARATIIWLVGEYEYGGGDDAEDAGAHGIAPDVLRMLVRGFAAEPVAAKQQIVLLAAKLYLRHLMDRRRPAADDDEDDEKTAVAILWEQVLVLARYDTSYDLRDRARLYRALLADPTATQLATLLLLAPKPVPHAATATATPSERRQHFLLGSASLALCGDEDVDDDDDDDGAIPGRGPGRALPGYEPVPDWVPPGEAPDPRLRDDDDRAEHAAAARTAGPRPPPASEKLDSAWRREQSTATTRPEMMASSHAAGAGQHREQKPTGRMAKEEKTLDAWLAEDAETDESSASEETSEEDEDEGEEEEEEEEDSESAEEQEKEPEKAPFL